jgi:hypothetical protein
MKPTTWKDFIILITLTQSFIMKKIITIALILFFLKTSGQDKNVVTNETIIELRKAQFSNELIISKINSSECLFQLGTGDMILLKKAGIEDTVMQAMINKDSRKKDEPKSPAASPYDKLTPGIYALDSMTATVSEIEPAIVTNRRTGGPGDVLGGKIFTTKTKLVLDGRESKQKLARINPVFIFVFDENDRTFNTHENPMGYFGHGIPTNVQSPNEFALLQMKSVKNTREFVVAKQSTIHSSGTDNIAFIFKKLKTGIYMVTLEKPLKVGEYGFMIAQPLSENTIFDNISNEKVYDFGIAAQ